MTISHAELKVIHARALGSIQKKKTICIVHERHFTNSQNKVEKSNLRSVRVASLFLPCRRYPMHNLLFRCGFFSVRVVCNWYTDLGREEEQNCHHEIIWPEIHYVLISTLFFCFATDERSVFLRIVHRHFDISILHLSAYRWACSRLGKYNVVLSSSNESGFFNWVLFSWGFGGSQAKSTESIEFNTKTYWNGISSA